MRLIWFKIVTKDLRTLLLGALAGVFGLLDLLVFYVGVRIFGREEILSKPT